jgi:hypothetical protein
MDFAAVTERTLVGLICSDREVRIGGDAYDGGGNDTNTSRRVQVPLEGKQKRGARKDMPKKSAK